MPSSVQHSFVPGTEGCRLHAATVGGSGPLMLFLHGFPEYWRAWHRQLGEFGKNHRAVALDLRGYNLSDKPEAVDAYTVPRLIGDIRAALMSLSPGQPAILVGHDWGGILAWALARESPSLLSHMVILNAPHPVLFYRELTQTLSQPLSSFYAGLFQLRGITEAALAAGDHALLKGMVWGASAKPEMFPDELRKDYLRAWSEPGALRGGLNYYRNVSVSKALVQDAASWKIHVPTLVLWGEKDPSLRVGNLEGLEAFVDTLVVKRHPSATHWIAHEEPAWVNARIADFLAGA